MATNSRTALLLLAALVAGTCQVPQKKDQSAKAYAPSMHLDLAPEVIERASAFSAAIEARCEQWSVEKERTDSERNARTIARHARRAQTGGYAKDVQARLVQLEDSLPQLPEGERQRAIEAASLLSGELDRLRCAHPEVFLVETSDSSMQMRPGTFLIVTGCKFGLRSGRVAAHLKEAGSDLELIVRNWDDDTILVEVPALTGVVDQPATIEAITFQGETSAPLQVDFIADRELQVVFCPYLSIDSIPNHLKTVFGGLPMTCAVSSAGPLTQSWRNLTSLYGFHQQYGDLYSTSGRDVIGLKLMNHWKLVEYHLESWGSSASGPDDGVVTSYDEVSLVRPGMLPSEQFLSFRVYWWVDDSNSTIEYQLSILVEGPVGTSYAAPEHVDLLDRLTAEGLIPGAPCN